MPEPRENARAALEAVVASELAAEVPDDARVLTDEIRRRHGDALAAVLYYGSCRRKKTTDGGVLDFYAVVDDYRGAYDSMLLAVSNHLLAPNVYYVELTEGGRTVRMKYAVVSRRRFADGTAGRTVDSIVWARFCQPSTATYVRDDDVRGWLAAKGADAVTTMVETMSALLAAEGGRFTDERLWQFGFAETYTTEFRTESPETIRSVYQADPDRYASVTEHAFADLGLRNRLDARHDDDRVWQVRFPSGRAGRLRLRWKAKKPAAKLLYAPRLVKSALTFGEWLPYAVWKLARHTGVKIEPTPLQRRHPLIFGIPVIVRLLLGRTLR